jgi:uncharacterized protein YqgQ
LWNVEGEKVKTIYDIQQFLKKFGTIIYVGDRVADLELMETEIQELYNSQLIETKDYQSAIFLLRQEIVWETEKRAKNK